MTTVPQTGTALLVMDLQQKMMESAPDAKTLLANAAKAIDAARKAGIPVIYVTLSFRAGHPEISASNAIFSHVKQSSPVLFTEGDESTIIPQEIAPQPGEILVHKKRISAFSGNDLEMLLRAAKAEHLVLAGYATSGIVLSTVREAFDKDYKQTVLADACADPDAETHQFLLTKILNKQAAVVSTADWIQSLSN